MNKDIVEFLKESNAIESVYDEDSLKQAIYAWEYISAQKELTTHDVLVTHQILMKNQNLLPEEKGFFRRCTVWIGGRQGLEYEKISKAIHEWVYFMNGKPEVANLEELSKKLHVGYEKIHPFVDGNGRTGRIFMNWWRVKNNLPILIIHEGKEQIEYYKWFR